GIDFCLRAATGRAYAFRLRQLDKSRRRAEEKRIEKALKNGGTVPSAAADLDPPPADPASNQSFPDVEKARYDSQWHKADKTEMRRWWIM
ncbi:UNVERIFIED_CONTAM: hypothetical protein QOZ12_28885, partial [Pseudomonas aeruginosa]